MKLSTEKLATLLIVWVDFCDLVSPVVENPTAEDVTRIIASKHKVPLHEVAFSLGLLVEDGLLTEKNGVYAVRRKTLN